MGGSPERMIRINDAWAVLSDPKQRASYDRVRARSKIARWDPYTGAQPAEPKRDAGTVLDIGRYAGWSIKDIAQSDPDFLHCLARTPVGRRFRAEIERVLAEAAPEPAPRQSPFGGRQFRLGFT